MRNRWPWDYDTLSTKLRGRYSDFSQNGRYKLRRPLEADLRYCHERLLDPKNPRSGRKRFYNPNIVSEFDRHYALKQG